MKNTIVFRETLVNNGIELRIAVLVMGLSLMTACNSGANHGVELDRSNSIAGPDINGNGVRDDIDAYIATLPDTAAQKSALKQQSSVLSKAMTVDLTNQTALLDVSRQIGAAAACNHSKYDPSTASKKSAEMEKLTVNTKQRFDAYVKFSKALSGTTFVLPQGDGCAN